MKTFMFTNVGTLQHVKTVALSCLFVSNCLQHQERCPKLEQHSGGKVNEKYSGEKLNEKHSVEKPNEKHSGLEKK